MSVYTSGKGTTFIIIIPRAAADSFARLRVARANRAVTFFAIFVQTSAMQNLFKHCRVQPKITGGNVPFRFFTNIIFRFCYFDKKL
jgi:hypothetical protein